MAVFLVVPTYEQSPKLAAKIQELESEQPNTVFQLPRGEWLVKYEGIARQLTEKLDVIRGEGVGLSEGAIIIAVANYWGVANADTWEWLASSSHGR